MARQFKYSGNWPVDFNIEQTMAPAQRALTAFEAAAIFIYLEELQKNVANFENANGKSRVFPASNFLETLLIKRFKEIAFDEKYQQFAEVRDLHSKIQGLSEIQQSRSVAPLVRDLFKDYLHYPNGQDVAGDKKGHQGAMIRRICGLGDIKYSNLDTEETLKFLEDYFINLEHPKEMKDVKMSDVKELVAQKVIVPSLGVPVVRPDVLAYTANGKDGSWLRLLEARYGADTSLAVKKRTEGLDLQDIKAHYIALTHKLRIEKQEPAYLPFMSDIEEAYDVDDLKAIGKAGYLFCLARNNMNIDDLRVLCNFHSLETSHPQYRSNQFTWEGKENPSERKIQVMCAYIKMWGKVNGLEIDVDDKNQVRELFEKFEPLTAAQIHEVNQELVKYFGTNVGLQEQLINYEIVRNTFEGQNQFFAFMENAYSEGDKLATINISNTRRLSSLYGIAKGFTDKSGVVHDPIPYDDLPTALKAYIDVKDPTLKVASQPIATQIPSI